ncbi:MAG: hypothetical protein H7X97_10205 [Opitutaceae bacterium]|nr:hypothetical protein [Verrucomicrobiales bacterium]
MKSRIIQLLAVLSLLWLTGCLEFEDQTVTYRYDAKTDTLRIFQDYHGIYGGKDKTQLEEEEITQLDSVLKGQRTFFFNNWIFEYDKDRSKEMLSELKDPIKRKEFSEPEAAMAAYEKLLALAIENVRIENGRFYLDAKGRLSATQRITVTQVARLISAGNGAIGEFLKIEAAKESTSPEDKSAYLKALQGPADFIRLQGNALTVHFPMQREQFNKVMTDEESGARQWREFKRQGGRVFFAYDQATWMFGSPTDSVATLSLPVFGGPYVTNAVAAIRKRVGIVEKFDASAAAKEFVNSSGGSGTEKKR